VFNGTFSTNRLSCHRSINYIVEPWDKTSTQVNNTINQENINSLIWALWRQSHCHGFFRGVFQANHSASTDNLARTTKRQNTYQCKLMIQMFWQLPAVNIAFTASTLFLDGNGIQPVQTQHWYNSDGDLTEALHISKNSSWHHCHLHQLLLK